MFEFHDRSRFEITALSFGQNDGSAMRARLEASVERFVDVSRCTDREVADRHLIPERDQIYYAEKAIYMSQCYQTNGAKRSLPTKSPCRGPPHISNSSIRQPIVGTTGGARRDVGTTRARRASQQRDDRDR
jgi:predicted O-linked N-acetylglucosamine transferase (SPINDLY family)